jgi:hypothetical protein
VLVVELERGAGEPDELALARDGWSAVGRAARFDDEGDAEPDGEPWLVAEGRTVIAAEPGRIRTVLHALDEPAGDPARFALSFARLFDGTARSAPGVVPLSERTAAGEPRSDPGAPPAEQSRPERGPYVDAALALWAALCALLALRLRA